MQSETGSEGSVGGVFASFLCEEQEMFLSLCLCFILAKTFKKQTTKTKTKTKKEVQWEPLRKAEPNTSVHKAGEHFSSSCVRRA
jgi:hypothetical protein